MAWVLRARPPSVELTFGSFVRSSGSGIFEGTWTGDAEAGPLRSTTPFGSGVLVEGDALYLVPPGHMLEGIYLCRRAGELVASNSLVGLLGPALDQGNWWVIVENMHVVSPRPGQTNEIDVHSNVIDGRGNATACTSYGVVLDVAAVAPASGVGIFRNNIIRGGECNNNAWDFYEADVLADPRIFENNDLDPYSSPTDLYFDEAATGIDLAADVDLLLDMSVSGTLSSNPTFVAYPGNLHIAAGSPCDGAGTPNGAPALDMDGDARDLGTPDIGADEI